MEVKVCVEDVQRIVCGVTERTTCQDVVIVLAQALGRTGRYTLRERFKGYERNVSPTELLLESLGKYGEQAKEVQLTLHYLGPSVLDNQSKPQVQLRRVEGGWKVCRGRVGAALHRQSLPPLSAFQSKPSQEQMKRTKRKSLTLMEEAWGWLENLGRHGRQQLDQDKGQSQRDSRGDKTDKVVVKTEKITQIPRDKQESKTKVSCLEKVEERVGVGREEPHEEQAGTDGVEKLQSIVLQQQAQLRRIQLSIDCTEKQISTHEEEQNSKEDEQLELLLNELRAEQLHEQELQRQFRELKQKAADCKNTLEEYKTRLQKLNLTDKEKASGGRICSHPQSSRPENEGVDGNAVGFTKIKVPHVRPNPAPVTEPPLSGPSELREWWSRWSEAQKPKPKVVHRSEMTIHLSSTRV